MSMNSKPLGNVDFSEFVLADQDPRNNLFMMNKQNTTPNAYPNGMPNASSMHFPAKKGPASIELDIAALNRGFAEAERNAIGLPPYGMTGPAMHDGSIAAPSNAPSVSVNRPMQSNPIMVSTNQHTAVSSSISKNNDSLNPYADYLASLQNTHSNAAGIVPEANMQGPITVAPNPVQNMIPLPAPAQMANMPGMVFPSALSGLNGQPPKKKSMKATAYDLMSDFIMRIPMFTNEQEVYIYDSQNGYYRRTPKHEVEQIIMDLYRPIIKEYGSGTLIEKAYKLLLKEPYIVRNCSPLSDPTKISFANCTVDIQNQMMLPHSPANVVTHAMTCNLARFDHAREDCPVFDKFLHDISGGDPVLEMRIWEVMGYCLTPDLNAKKFFIFQGAHDSGKSLLCNLISDYFPEAKVTALNVHSLNEKFSSGHLRPFELCVSPDLPIAPLDTKSTSVIKQITGNDKISAPVKYKDNVDFRYKGKLILASNYPLLTEVSDEAFMQRAVVVPFLYTIPKEAQDFTLFAKLQAEKPAIASKALDAYFRLRDNHYQFSGNYEINTAVAYPDAPLDVPEIAPLVYNFLISYFEKDSDGLVAVETAYDLFTQEVSDQFTEKMFSSAFRRFAEELYGASKVRAYHDGRFKNARSSIKGIRFKQRQY